MKKIGVPIIAMAVLCWTLPGFGQDGTSKVGIINIQAAIAQSNDGQEAARQLQTRFGPTRTELEKQQREIADLQTQLRNQERTLSEEARTRLLRSIDDKTKAFNRSNEDATAEFQQAEQDAINEIGRKMIGVIDEYAKKNRFSLILDVSSPQTPVLYADAAIDVTKTIIDLYNQATATPATGSAPAPAPGSTAAPAAAPPAAPAAAPAARPATPPAAAPPTTPPAPSR